MTWMEFLRLGDDARWHLLVLDSCVNALAASRDVALLATVTAELPTTQGLCALLDAHAVPVTRELEAQIGMRGRLVEFARPDSTIPGRSAPGEAAIA